MNGVAQKKVGPRDCVLAFAIPLTKDDFLHDLRATSGKDFIKSIAQTKMWVSPESLWELFYKPQLRVVLQVADEVALLGVKTVFNLKVNDLGLLLANADVFTLVAHWRSDAIRTDDLINPSSLVAKLRESTNEKASVLRTQFNAEMRQCLDSFDDSQSHVRAVVSELNRLLENKGLFLEHGSEDTTLGKCDRIEHTMHFNRAALEQIFPGEFREGGRVELDDGLCTIDEFVNLVPWDYRGILDLTMCNSILLGEAIKRRRRNCLIMVNQKPARIDFRLIFYKHVIKELARRKNRYVDIVVQLRKRMIETIGDEDERASINIESLCG